MIIVTGHLVVDPADRDSFLADCLEVVRRGRAAEGCLDFSLSSDPIDPARINVLERWQTRAHLDAFRGQGPAGEHLARIRSATVADYPVVADSGS